MASETENREFRTGTPKGKKVVAAHSFDPDDLAWIDEARGQDTRSAFLRGILKDARAGKGSVPKVLRGGTRIVHLVSINRAEDRLYLNSSGVYPETGPPFGVPHDAVGRTDEFVQKGRHAFDEKCEACRLLADFLLEG